MERFRFLERIARPYKDKELSLSDINKLIHAMNQSLLSRGFSTSRIVVPEQNLSLGELRLVLQIGYIGTVRFAEDSDALYWKNLFPFHEGDILNVRDIEQGIEQAKRLPSQDISVQLLPSEQPQRTDVVLTVKRGKNFYGTISVDDSGLEDTGKLQWYTSIGMSAKTDFTQFLERCRAAHSSTASDINGGRLCRAALSAEQKPEGFHTSDVTSGFSLGVKF